MTSRTITAMPRTEPRKPTGRLMRALHIVVSGRGKPARVSSTRSHNVRVAIWLPGWHIEVYDEFDNQPDLSVVR